MISTPDAKAVLNNGRIVEPYVVGHRAIGGHPGPVITTKVLGWKGKSFCGSDPVFKDHPAMDTWDVWNEPEELKITLSGNGNYKGLFTGKSFSLDSRSPVTLPPEFTDLLVKLD